MGWHSRHENERADYIRDLRKHEEWPDDPIMILLPEPTVKEINPWPVTIAVTGWVWIAIFFIAVALI